MTNKPMMKCGYTANAVTGYREQEQLEEEEL